MAALSPHSGTVTSRSHSGVTCSSMNTSLDSNGAARLPLRPLDSNVQQQPSATRWGGHPLPRRNNTADDQAAIQRAVDVLSGISGHILRNSKVPCGSRSRESSMMKPSSRPDSVCRSHEEPPHPCAAAHPVGKGKRTRALELPATIPVHRSGSRSVSTGSRSLNGRRRRSHATESVLSHMEEDATMPQPQRTDDPTYTALFRSFRVPSRTPGWGAVSSPAAAPPATGLPVCQPMFKGLSAIPLSDNLFEGVMPASNSSVSMVRVNTTQLVTPVGPLPSAISPPHGPPTATVPARCAMRPLWSLLGTFKTALAGIVELNVANDYIRWTQRNPRGGRQTFHIAIGSILDVIVVRVEREDEDIREAQHTVVIRTSSRPSQVIFGFRTAREATHLKTLLRKIIQRP